MIRFHATLLGYQLSFFLLASCRLDMSANGAGLFAPESCEDKTGKFLVESINKRRTCKKFANINRCNNNKDVKENCPRSCGECGCIDTTKSFDVVLSNGNTSSMICSEALNGKGEPKKNLCKKIGDTFCPETCESEICDDIGDDDDDYDDDDDDYDDDDDDDDDDDCSDDKGTFTIKGNRVSCSDGSSNCNSKMFYSKCSKTCGYCDCQDFGGNIKLNGQTLKCKNGINNNGGPKKKYCKQVAFNSFCPNACGICGDSPTPPPTASPIPAPTPPPTPRPTVTPGLPTKTPTLLPSYQPSKAPMFAPTPAPTIVVAPTPVPTTAPPTASPISAPTPPRTVAPTPAPTMSMNTNNDEGFSFVYDW